METATAKSPSISAGDKSSSVGTYMVFELANRQTRKNGYIRDDTRGTSNPISINAPQLFMLPVTSRHHLGKGLGYVPIQYVPGADTCFVDNYVDAKGELRKGLKEQGYKLDEERNRAMNNQQLLRFKNGILDLHKYGEDPALVAFVNMHENNAESPSGKNRNSSVLGMFKFQPVKAELKAATRTNRFEDDFEGMSIVKDLRTKTGTNEFVYDEIRMNAVISLLGIPVSHYGLDSKSQKFEDILRHAQAGPAKFAEIVKSGIAEAEMIVAKGNALGILQISSKSANLKLGSGAAITIYEYPAKHDSTKQISTLALALLGDPNLSNHAVNLRTEVESRG